MSPKTPSKVILSETFPQSRLPKLKIFHYSDLNSPKWCFVAKWEVMTKISSTGVKVGHLPQLAKQGVKRRWVGQVLKNLLSK